MELPCETRARVVAAWLDANPKILNLLRSSGPCPGPRFWKKYGDRNKPPRPELVPKARELSMTPNAIHQRRHREKYPDRMAARSALTNALKSGQITRQPCEICGNPKTHGHHEDYSKPLDIRWLCRAHHGAVHRKRNRLVLPPIRP